MTGTSTHRLGQLPDARPLLVQALTKARRKVDPDLVLPPLSVTVSGVCAPVRLLERYREVCGFAQDQRMPITYPQVLATSLQLWLMTRPEFPLPLLGLVHLRNRIEQAAGLAEDGLYEISASVGQARREAAGVSFDLHTSFVDAAGTTVYRAVTTPILRIKSDRPRGPRAPQPAVPVLADYQLLEAPEDTGRRYAAVSGDYNPIHLHALGARLFGFPRAIAHGMWSVARCAALLQRRFSADPKLLEVQYRAPLLLPGCAVLKSHRTLQGEAFELLAAGGDRVHLTGLIA